jgi:uncharacterized protein YqeY
MSLSAQIDDMIKQAMREKRADDLGTLRLLKSAVQYAAIEKHGADGVATDDEVIAVVRKEIKKREDSVESYTKAGRAESAAREQSEIDYLKKFLPAAMSEEELKALVQACVAETGATGKAQMGAVMKLAKERAGSRADGKQLSSLVQQALS